MTICLKGVVQFKIFYCFCIKKRNLIFHFVTLCGVFEKLKVYIYCILCASLKACFFLVLFQKYFSFLPFIPVIHFPFDLFHQLFRFSLHSVRLRLMVQAIVLSQNTRYLFSRVRICSEWHSLPFIFSDSPSGSFLSGVRKTC